jgi:hypothetical protein
MIDGFKVGNGLKQGGGLAPNFFHIALECVKGNCQCKTHQQYFTNQFN